MASAALQYCMGLFLTLLYILAAYLAPETLFGPLAEYHIQIVIAFLALVTSLPSLQRISLGSVPQSYALIGMCIAVLMSFIFNGLTGLAPAAVLDFLPNAFTFFLVALNFRTKRHLQLLISVLVAASFFTIYMGYTAILAGNLNSPYLMTAHDAAVPFSRLRGLAFISDPNDFSQLLVSVIPLLFFFWAPKSFLRNFFFVFIPAGILLFGLFLTHSRGGIVAFLAVVIIGARRRIGTIPSLITGGVLFAVATAIGWSGGREISVESGSDRMEAWSTGLQLLKSHPLFGVGFQRFSEYFIITAHNTVVVCAAELGTFGLFFWVMFILPTVRDIVAAGETGKSKEQLAIEEQKMTPFEQALAARAAEVNKTQAESRHSHYKPIGSPITTAAPNNVASGASPYFADEEATSELPEEELRRLARLLMLSLTGFLVAGWFLSRAYVMTLFLYGGMVQVIYELALKQGLVPARMGIPRVLRLSAIWVVALIAVVYIMLRVQNLMPH
jgi:O-Antigen ligase